MGTTYVKGGKTQWLLSRSEICSSKRPRTCVGNHMCKGWHNPDVGKIPGTHEHSSSPQHMHFYLFLCMHGLITQGLCQWLCCYCTSLGQCLWFCSWSPMFFDPEWEVKLQEKSCLLCCAKILGKLRFPLAAAAWAAALFAHMQHSRQPRCFLEAGEVSPWKRLCYSRHKAVAGICDSEKNVFETWQEAWWPQLLRGRRGGWWRGHTGKLVATGKGVF